MYVEHMLLYLAKEKVAPEQKQLVRGWGRVQGRRDLLRGEAMTPDLEMLTWQGC